MGGDGGADRGSGQREWAPPRHSSFSLIFVMVATHTQPWKLAPSLWPSIKALCSPGCIDWARTGYSIAFYS